ncbi:hypothetical protein [Acinetobacter gerneri]|uniref:Uncharacterized protein n=1 Tax=Acinetobacter gerneri DSM 14967 = CIP 107464 = MTCC 9824 TaxID=1120926 RepID=N8Y944_9GAMM|nr:hypothetical protein [Acinetobacter gerneri]ENV33156.1 hypothetical protein F960_02878 [Acinetobacter gerneri DSM 14967 = CIP 107464 = MTCC 9824]EPR80218.1 hypothetical protein L289_0883 [Acinetobacter gerneri DSM 14967 = CIP 107464 = MTCC 9824]
MPSLLTDKLANQLKWKNSATDKTLLERGLVHLNEDDAICHAQAHIIVSGGAIQRNDNIASIDKIVLFKDPITQNETITDELQTASAEQVTELRQDQQELLDELLPRVDSAQTPNEATALSGYTTSWTEQQRKPLLDKIHKRLVELNPISAIPPKEAPSLMVRIENAPDLVTLSELEIEVKGRHPDIQPKLMGYVKKRRYELDNA